MSREIIAVNHNDHHKLFVADHEEKTLDYCGSLPSDIDLEDYKESNPNTNFVDKYPEDYIESH